MVQKQEKPTCDDALDTLSEAEAAYGLSQWFGAIFFYFAAFGRRPFDTFYTKKYETRNVIVGWLLQVGAVLLVSTLLMLFYPN